MYAINLVGCSIRMIDIKVRKICLGCKKIFETTFPNRKYCNICLYKADYLKGESIILEGVPLTLWDVDDSN